MSIFLKVFKINLIKELPNIKFEKDKICDACQMGKQTRISFKSTNMLNNTRPLHLLHMDLFGPSRALTLDGK